MKFEFVGHGVSLLIICIWANQQQQQQICIRLLFIYSFFERYRINACLKVEQSDISYCSAKL